jgi:hypothetical protein
MPVVAMQVPMRQHGQQHKQAGHDQDGMRRQERNLHDADQDGDDRHRDDQQGQMQKAMVAMMMGMKVAPVPVMTVMMTSAGVAVFAGRTFIQREFVADTDIDFAHSISLQSAALLAAPDISSPNHQKSINIK